jgi:periplasmic protein TonB
MYAVQPWSRERLVSAAGVALVHALLGYALITGLKFELPRRVAEELKLIEVLPPPDPPKPKTEIPHEVKSERPEGEASPPNLRAEPTQIVLPPPKIPVPTPNPMPVAPIAGVGNAPSAGSADIPGPGYGAGGFGDGRGAGGYGDGDGEGGADRPPRQRRGRLSYDDAPDYIREQGIGGTVGVRYQIEADGRVSACEVTRSSGHPALDDVTCREIMRRFRFDPARDPRGNKVPSVMIQNHIWEPLPPEYPDR